MLAIILFLFLPYLVIPESSPIFEYGPLDFKEQIRMMEGNFIMFYTPSCHQCRLFHPIWEELAAMTNTQLNKNVAIAQVDCTIHSALCQENDITGYPSLRYFRRNTFTSQEYTGTRDMQSLMGYLTDQVTITPEGIEEMKKSSEVKIYLGMAYLTDYNVEKFLSTGYHFVMFYAPWCRASQNFAPTWSLVGAAFAETELHIGKVNCMESEMTCKNFDIKQYPSLLWIVHGRIMGVADVGTLEELNAYVHKMVAPENYESYDPEKFIKKKKTLPVARISEETFETSLEKDLVFVNYFAPWCAHCMQLSPLWLKLGEKFQNESKVLIADVDCVESKPICETENIHGLPTLILYQNKKIVAVEHGGRPLESLITLVSDHLKESSNTITKGAVVNDDSAILTKDEL